MAAVPFLICFYACWLCQACALLYDRKELRRQAKNAFTQFLPDCNVSILTRTREPAAQVVLGTYPAMMKRFQQYDVAWFDLIIADESHRSIYNKYRFIPLL